MKRDDYIRTHWQNYEQREGGPDRSRSDCEAMAGAAWDRERPETENHLWWLRGQVQGAEAAQVHVRTLAGEAFADGQDEKARFERSIARALADLVVKLRQDVRAYAEANGLEVLPGDLS